MPSSASGGIDNTFRRKWDRAEFEKKAAERTEREEAQLKARDKGKPASASGKISGNEIIIREPLRRREEDLQLALNVGKTQVINLQSGKAEQGGFFCNVCDCIMKDHASYLDHINGRKHQKNLGMSMRVERSTVDQVRERLDYHKRKQSEVTDVEKELDERISGQMEEEEALRRKKKERKKEKAAPVEEIDPDIAAMMGFGGFGSSKK